MDNHWSNREFTAYAPYIDWSKIMRFLKSFFSSGVAIDNFEKLPTGKFRFIAIDVETANDDIATICQIGIACISGSNIKAFQTLIDPEDKISPRNNAIHGIGDRSVSGQPTLPQAISSMRHLLEANLLIQHSSFDKRAFAAACARYDLSPLHAKWGDSIAAARKAWPHLRENGGYGLKNVARYLNLSFNHHSAVEDAWASARIMLEAEKATGLTPLNLIALNRSSGSYPKRINSDGAPDGPLQGHVAVFTGQITIDRKSAADLAAKTGMKVAANVTKKTTHLVVGAQDLTKLAGNKKSSKHRKAEELKAAGQDISIIGEAEFLKIISSV